MGRFALAVGFFHSINQDLVWKYGSWKGEGFVVVSPHVGNVAACLSHSELLTFVCVNIHIFYLYLQGL